MGLVCVRYCGFLELYWLYLEMGIKLRRAPQSKIRITSITILIARFSCDKCMVTASAAGYLVSFLE